MNDWNHYSRSREGMKYYDAIRSEVERLSGGSILDIGCGGTNLVAAGDFDTRLAVNLDPVRNYPHPLIVGRWPEVALPQTHYDVVLCCQVLEHLLDAQIPEFVTRMLETATRAIVVSVPYRWPRGTCSGHQQDPVNETKLHGWIGRKPSRQSVITDRLRRLVATYEVG